MPRRRSPAQPSLAFPITGRGGRRPGAGRPRTSGRRRVEHTTRPFHTATDPLHVTLRCRAELGDLRCEAARDALAWALCRAVHRVHRFRIVHVSLQRDHLHLIIEAADRLALTRGMQGFAISFARALNRGLHRRGRVFADRFHARALATPREVRHGLAYVLNNWRKHGADRGHRELYDRYASAPQFAGWTDPTPLRWPPGATGLPTAFAKSWLLTTGWRRHRRVSPLEVPGRA